MRDQRRKERANVENRLQGVHLRCEVLASEPLRVVNISELGVGVETAPIAKSPSPEQVLDAKLLVGRTVAGVKVRLVHMTPQLTGLVFVDPSDLLKGAIRQYFEPELVGASLRPVKTENGSEAYETREGDRVEVWLKGGALERFRIRVLGNSVEWDRKHGVRLLQNARAEKAPEFLRKQLVKLVQSIEFMTETTRREVEHALAGVELP